MQCLLHFIALITLVQHQCRGSDPPDDDLLVGREEKLVVSSTCGSESPQPFCIVENGKSRCEMCDSRLPYNQMSGGATNNSWITHRPENMVDSKTDFLRRWYWWQSEPGVQEVSIEVQLGRIFHFTHLYMKFRTLLPHSMFVERSLDLGATWQVYRYFSYACDEVFPGIPTVDTGELGYVYCESKYSQPYPSKDGEFFFRVIGSGGGSGLYDTSQVHALLKLTNLRVKFVRFHTLGASNIDSDKRSYFYAITLMRVGGQCFCNGHASSCVRSSSGVLVQPDVRGMVYSNCQCDHHTTGLNCELCMQRYQALPWQPWSFNNPFQCQECTCNNHADRCQFNRTLFEATGNGGECLECEDDTEGPFCDRCRLGYSLQLGRTIRDAYPCRRCDFEPRGTLPGICDWETGEVLCKAAVTGARCDRCRDGYYRLSEANPDGCLPCGCFPGGSHSVICDKHSGQCPCRNNFIGRQCDTFREGYFVPEFTFFRLEAEWAEVRPAEGVLVQRRGQPGGPITWSGDGFLELGSGDTIEWEMNGRRGTRPSDSYVEHHSVPAPESSFRFIPLIRLKPTNSVAGWNVTLAARRERLSVNEPPAFINRPCEMSPDSEVLTSSAVIFLNQLSQSGWTAVLNGPLCLPANMPLRLMLTTQALDAGSSGSLVVDSVVLLPMTEDSSLDHFGVARDSVDQCRVRQYSLFDRQPLSTLCRNSTIQLMAEVYQGAKHCFCDLKGTVSGAGGSCQPIGGQCTCKTNVIGRRCDRCLRDTFNITSPYGCTDCECSEVGSLPAGSTCDPVTGRCQCKEGAFGPKCDQCQFGRWNFPTCSLCPCHGHADTCDPWTGRCTQCAHNTDGFHCETCRAGFYGSADQLGGECKPCQCPATFTGAFNQSEAFYADGCGLDQSNNLVCRCRAGYTGDRCTECADGYFGDPVAGVACARCECNGREADRVRKCDPRTGLCLGCVDNAAGDHCEQCATGFTRDPTSGYCLSCNCDARGTLESACDPLTGQCTCNPITGDCPCRPHVIGRDCGRCEALHFGLGNPQGCLACACSPIGSSSQYCSQDSGQCSCKPNFGGRRCDECVDSEYGDPLTKCLHCNCDPLGSLHNTCNKTSGQCVCHPGVGGRRCDTCSRGTKHDYPTCTPCGPCFDNWDAVIADLGDEVALAVEASEAIEMTGSVGAYAAEFDKLDGLINNTEQLLSAQEQAISEATRLKNDISSAKSLAERLVDLVEGLAGFNDHYRTMLDMTDLDAIEQQLTDIELRIVEMEQRKDTINAQSLDGITQRMSVASMTSHNASLLADSLLSRLTDIETRLSNAEDFLRQVDPATFKDAIDVHEKNLETLDERVGEVDDFVKEMSTLMCGGGGECEQCGGASCSFCGNVPTAEGIVLTTCKGAATYARKAEHKVGEIMQLLMEKLAQAKNTLQKVAEAVGEVKETHDSSEELRRRAVLANEAAMRLNDTLGRQLGLIDEQKESSHQTITEVRKLIDQINNFDMPNITQQDIQSLETEIASMEAEINRIRSMTNEARSNSSLVKTLLDEAVEARETAQAVYDAVASLLNKKDAASEANRLTNEILQNSTDLQQDIGNRINGLRSQIEELDAETAEAERFLRDVETRLDAMTGGLNSLRMELDDADQVTRQANRTITETQQAVEALERRYQNLSALLEKKTEEMERLGRLGSEAASQANDLTDNADKASAHLLKLNEKVELQLEQLAEYEEKIAALLARVDVAWDKVRYQYQLKWKPECPSVNFPDQFN